VPKTKEYLDFCTERGYSLIAYFISSLTKTADATCEVNRCREIKADRSPFCANHTCRERDCEMSCFTKPYCDERGFMSICVMLVADYVDVCAEAKCEYPKPWLGKQKTWGKFCPMREYSLQDAENLGSNFDRYLPRAKLPGIRGLCLAVLRRP
jgi:hypothetical protein